METEKLKPRFLQKSFHGKAHVITMDDGWRFLKSYATIMAGIGPDGLLRKFSNAVSNTTMRHIVEFVDQFLNDKITRREFLMLNYANNPHGEIEGEQ